MNGCTPFSDRSIEQLERKRVQGIGYLNTISKLQLIDKYEMFNPTFEGYTFSSSTHRILMNIGHILSYKVQLNKFQGTAIIQNIHSDCPKRISTIPPPTATKNLQHPMPPVLQLQLVLAFIIYFCISFFVIIPFISYFIAGACVVLMLTFIPTHSQCSAWYLVKAMNSVYLSNLI